ncbi:uncharacterized protein PHALS_11858 [Plasmopara halstedii]|uniref:RxLR-like protein n=1 Tax=Plasmopara halstedii TaxID=4781 RepID=A0A0P1AKX4_PLAHL|nr:uncharacterized protein PHALS_11858 [Plasmopara halstedii]CEG41517.1 hypothetical protein PHALS_11858 [Plasmopara halstedii]|eukprot:XP_024577886.1 hypothetical protein PHALS_11858 [Plasmopara halstedii]
MLAIPCVEFSSLKCLIGITLCISLHSAIGQVNDRGSIVPEARSFSTHNTAAAFKDALPIQNGSGESKLDIDTSDKEERSLIGAFLDGLQGFVDLGGEVVHFGTDHLIYMAHNILKDLENWEPLIQHELEEALQSPLTQDLVEILEEFDTLKNEVGNDLLKGLHRIETKLYVLENSADGLMKKIAIDLEIIVRSKVAYADRGGQHSLPNVRHDESVSSNEHYSGRIVPYESDPSDDFIYGLLTEGLLNLKERTVAQNKELYTLITKFQHSQDKKK